MSSPIGYGPKPSLPNMFDGDERNYEKWEVKFLAQMKLFNLKDVILSSDHDYDDTNDADKNEMAYAILVQSLDDKSLALVMNDAQDDGREALKILRSHYRGASTPRIIGLYTELTSLKMMDKETVTEYVIRAEKAAVGLKLVGETVSDSLLIAMVLKGLPETYQSFVTVVTQSQDQHSFKKFKEDLRSHEETVKSRKEVHKEGKEEFVLKVQGDSHGGRSAECFRCGSTDGHFARDCTKNTVWCSFCKRSNHTRATCRKLKSRGRDGAALLQEAGNTINSNINVSKQTESSHSFIFKVDDKSKDIYHSHSSLLVDCGATSHIINDRSKFVSFDSNFRPERHYVELANGQKENVAQARGLAQVFIKNSKNELCEIMLHDALYIPTFPQEIFSVQASTAKGASVSFQPSESKLVYENHVFDIELHGKLYYLTIDNIDKINHTRDLFTWHETLGHCNFEDILKLENVVKGMNVSNKKKSDCETCILGKMTNHISRTPRTHSNEPLKLIHTDLAGPVLPESNDGIRYAIIFTDDFSDASFVYFMKNKSDTVRVTEKFIADMAPIGEIKALRSDNGGEFTSNEFRELLRKNKIHHETCAPYSPHQNGTAERKWRTVFEMARCMMIQKQLPKLMWPYAVHTAVYTRNRCYNARIKQTPYQGLTGRKPNISHMHVFGSKCYAYCQNVRKLDPRCTEGVFVGYDGYSPAYLVYFPETGKINKCRNVYFVEKDIKGKVQTQKESYFSNDDESIIEKGPVMNNTVENNKTRTQIQFNTFQSQTEGQFEEQVRDQGHTNGQNGYDQNHIESQNDNQSENNGQGQSGNQIQPGHIDDDQIQNENQGQGQSENLIQPGHNDNDQTQSQTSVQNENQGQSRNQGQIEYTSQPGQIEIQGQINDPVDHNSSRYPTRNRKRPTHLEEYETNFDSCDHVNSNMDCCFMMSHIPKTYRQAVNSHDHSNWHKAMEDEMNSLKDNNTFDLVPLPEGKNTVGGKWVYNIKESANGTKSFKARYVAKGYSQIEGIDYSETFAPTANLTSVRVLAQMAAEHDLILHQMDVKTAYLNAPIDCEIFMEQAEGYEVKGQNGQKLVYRLNKSLYGLKQSGRNWNQLLHSFLNEKGFVQSPSDNCVYSKQEGGEMIIVLVWVDDFIIGAKSEECLANTKQMFMDRFKMKDLGPLSYFLGIDFTQEKNCVRMNQRRYIEKMLEKFQMTDCKPRSTPSEQKFEEGESDFVDSHKYREIVGSLIYVMIGTRPDICWTVTKLSQHLSNPTQGHLIAAKHVLRYLKGTIDYELCYKKSVKGLKVTGYSDADWASDSGDRRSISGFCFCLNENGPPISWKSKKQPVVALSTCEAEYIALALAVQESIYLKQLLSDLKLDQDHADVHPCVIFEDNQGTIALAHNPVHRQRSKHIDIKFHFIRDEVRKRKVNLKYCPTNEMVADLFTKPSVKVKLIKFKSFLFGE